MKKKEVVIDSGLVTYDIKDKEGRCFGQFTFNPSDTDILKRHGEVIEAFEKIEIPNTEGKDLVEEIDYLLGFDSAESFFSIMGPLSPLASGQFYIESVLDAIGQAISAETGERVKKISGKIAKHTSKYHR